LLDWSIFLTFLLLSHTPTCIARLFYLCYCIANSESSHLPFNMDDVSQPERLKNFAHGLRMCNQPSTQLFRDRINASGIDPKYRKFLEHAFKVYDIGIWSKFWAPSEFEERATNYLVECGRMLKTPDMNKASAKESLKAEYDRLEKYVRYPNKL